MSIDLLRQSGIRASTFLGAMVTGDDRDHHVIGEERDVQTLWLTFHGFECQFDDFARKIRQAITTLGHRRSVNLEPFREARLEVAPNNFIVL